MILEIQKIIRNGDYLEDVRGSRGGVEDFSKEKSLSTACCRCRMRLHEFQTGDGESKSLISNAARQFPHESPRLL